MKEDRAKLKLLQLLDREFFDPVSHVRLKYIFGMERRSLEKIRSEVDRLRGRFHSCRTGAAVHALYHEILLSDPGQRLDTELRGRGLPSLSGVKNEFEEIARTMRVGFSHPHRRKAA